MGRYGEVRVRPELRVDEHSLERAVAVLDARLPPPPLAAQGREQRREGRPVRQTLSTYTRA